MIETKGRSKRSKTGKNNMKNVIKTVWEWLVKSSADPNKISLTIKGALSTAIIVLGYFGITGQQLDVTSIADNSAEVIVQIVAAVTTLTTLYGAARKIWLTLSKAWAR
jgi:hypothetical protein